MERGLPRPRHPAAKDGSDDPGDWGQGVPLSFSKFISTDMKQNANRAGTTPKSEGHRTAENLGTEGGMVTASPWGGRAERRLEGAPGD